MDYEKEYKQALSRATFYNNELLTENQRKMLLDIFPELTMSEDERIRKALIEMIHDTTGDECEDCYHVSKESPSCIVCQCHFSALLGIKVNVGALYCNNLKEKMDNLFGLLDRLEAEEHHCRTCKHHKRFELNEYSSKVVQCCDLQPSNRSNSGYKTIKVTDFACGFYEPVLSNSENTGKDLKGGEK